MLGTWNRYPASERRHPTRATMFNRQGCGVTGSLMALPDPTIVTSTLVAIEFIGFSATERHRGARGHRLPAPSRLLRPE